MKKTFLALSMISAIGFMSTIAGSAAAQSTVTIYGIADTGIAIEKGGSAGSVSKLTSGIGSGSRLGFKGTEDLGGGLSAFFLLESGINIDAGSSGQGGLMFGRQAYVGVKGDFGTLTAGRQYTPEYLTLAFADPFGTGFAGDAANIMPNSGTGASRMDNTLKYVTPSFDGFTGELAYGFGETAGDTSTGRQIGAAIGYTSGPFAVRLGYHKRNNDTTTLKNTEDGKTTLLAATYDFGVAKAHLAYGINKGLNSSPLRNTANPYGSLIAPTASTDSTDFLLGVTMPFGSNKILASYIRKDDKTTKNQDASQLAVAYIYSLSKRTDLYAAYARIDNKNGAGYTVGSAIEAGSGDSALHLGIRHSF